MCCEPNFCEGTLLGQNRFRVELRPNTRQSPATTRCTLNIRYIPCSCWTGRERGVRTVGCCGQGKRKSPSRARQSYPLSVPISSSGFFRQCLQKMSHSSSVVGAVRAYKLAFSINRRAVSRRPPKISLSEFESFILWLPDFNTNTSSTYKMHTCRCSKPASTKTCIRETTNNI